MSNVKKNNKQKKNSPKKGKRIGITLFFFVLIIVGVFVGCLFTPAFNVTEIMIEDGEHITRQEILNKVDDVAGINILKIISSKLERDVETIPYVRTAKVSKILPDKLKVTYTERVPYMLIKYLESYIIMDKYGYILEVIAENTFDKLPIIYGIELENIEVGAKLGGTEEAKYESIVYLMEAVYQVEFDYTIYEINYEKLNNLQLAIREMKIDIEYGEINKENALEKVTYLNGILKELNGKRGNLDISSDNYKSKTIFIEKY